MSTTRERDLAEADTRYAGWSTRDQARVAFAEGCSHTRRLVADDLEAIAKLYYGDAADDGRRRALMLAARRIRTGEYLESAATPDATDAGEVAGKRKGGKP